MKPSKQKYNVANFVANGGTGSCRYANGDEKVGTTALGVPISRLSSFTN